jgi:nitric oxide reductase NorQ protein
MSLEYMASGEGVQERLSWKERILGRKNSRIDIHLNPLVNVYVNGKKETDVEVEVKNADLETAVESADPLLDYRIAAEPFYTSMNGEVGLFEVAAKERLPVMLKGPTGCGKTRFVEHMAYKLGRPLITVNCQEDLSAADLAGRLLLNEKGTYWQDGSLAKSARYGAICYLDEIVEARNDAMVLIHSLTDHRRILPIDKTGEVIEAHPNFMLVVSYNPHYQSALKTMKQSTRQRFVSMEFDYPTKEKEIGIVQKESNVKYDLAEKLVGFGQKVRSMKGQGLSEGASTRLLIYAGKLMRSGIPTLSAVETAIVNPLTDEVDIQKSVRDAAKTYFGGK